MCVCECARTCAGELLVYVRYVCVFCVLMQVYKLVHIHVCVYAHASLHAYVR